MSGAVLERFRRSDAADPFNWVVRAKIQSLMNEHYHRCKETVVQHLEAYYGERQGNVFTRAGVTARVTAELFESQANKLLGLLVDSVKPPLRNARSFQMVTESMNGFISYLDMTMNTIGPRIDLEMRNFPQSDNYVQNTGDIWSESRARVVEKLEVQRTKFGFAARPAPDSDEPETREVASDPAQTAYFPPEPAFEEPLTLDPETILPELPLDAQVAVEPEAWLPEPDAVGDSEPESPLAFEPEPAAQRPEPEAPASLAQEFAGPAQPMQHWQEMWTDIAVQLCTGRLRPDTQDQVAGAMTKWFATRGIEGIQADVDQCARRFWQKLAATRRITSNIVTSTSEAAMDGEASLFDRLALQAGLPGAAGLLTGGNALQRQEPIHCSLAVTPPVEMPGNPLAIEPPCEDTMAATIRYQVSWSMPQASRMTAPYLDID